MSRLKPIFSKKRLIVIFSLVLISTLFAKIDLPHSKEYSTIINLDGKNFYIYFKKPDKNKYSKINVVLLDEDIHDINNMEIEADFRNKINFDKTTKDMQYETELTKRSDTEYSGKFRLIYEGLWELKIKILYDHEVLNFKDSFYYFD